MSHFFDVAKLTKAIHEGHLQVSHSKDYTWGDAAELAQIMMGDEDLGVNNCRLGGLFDVDETKLMMAIRDGELSLSPSGYPYSCTQAREEAQEMIRKAKHAWNNSVWDK